MLDGPAALLEFGFDVGEAVAEFAIGAAEGLFGVDFVESGDVDEGEEEVSEFTFAVGWGGGLLEFVEFLADFVEDAIDIGPIESGGGGFGGDLGGFGEGGLGAGDAVEEALGGGLFGLFDLVPALFDFVGSSGVAIGEDVGVAADEFVVDVVEGGGDVEEALFAGDFCVEDGLEEEVAEFLGEGGKSRRSMASRTS